jgi:starvation-inducible DNA-binding protein
VHRTRNTLPDNTRKTMIELLQTSLCDGVDLQSQVKQAHWNVKGPDFIGLHELFDQIHGIVTGHVDGIAERLVTLGGEAAGTARDAAARSRLPEYPHGIAEGPAHAAALADALAAFSSTCRKAVDSADEAGDAITADLYTNIARELDKQVWFVEAHLQAER